MILRDYKPTLQACASLASPVIRQIGFGVTTGSAMISPDGRTGPLSTAEVLSSIDAAERLIDQAAGVMNIRRSIMSVVRIIHVQTGLDPSLQAYFTLPI